MQTSLSELSVSPKFNGHLKTVKAANRDIVCCILEGSISQSLVRLPAGSVCSEEEGLLPGNRLTG